MGFSERIDTILNSNELLYRCWKSSPKYGSSKLQIVDMNIFYGRFRRSRSRPATCPSENMSITVNILKF